MLHPLQATAEEGGAVPISLGLAQSALLLREAGGWKEIALVVEDDA